MTHPLNPNREAIFSNPVELKSRAGFLHRLPCFAAIQYDVIL